MKLLIKNATIITMNKNKDIIKSDVLISDNIIDKIVTNYDGEYDRVIDATNMVLMPGLINSHTHLGMSVFRGTNDGLNLNDWLFDKIFPIEDKMIPSDFYYSNLVSVIEMIKTGTTCACDNYFGWKDSLKAIEEGKIRCLFSRCINDPDGSFDKRVNEFEDLVKYNKENPNDLITLSVSPHSLYTCSDKCLIKCRELSDKYDLPINIHFCENRNEVKTIEEIFHMKPIKVLEHYGYLDKKLILAHATFLEDDNIELLKKDNIYISHNILSNLNLGCGIVPIKKYKDVGLNLCLGTDGQGSAENLDMFNGMQLTSLVSKGMMEEPKYTSSYDILEMATINGAKALGLSDKIGSIEVGKCADVIILDLNDMYPINNLISQVVHNVKPSNVKYTIINGNVLLDNGELTIDIDEKDLKKHVEEIVNRLGLKEKQVN